MKTIAAITGHFALTLAMTAAPVLAQEVRIISKDGAINIGATLLSAEDGLLTLKTEIGIIAVEQNLVFCEGEACPKGKEFDFTFRLAGSGDLAETLIPILFEGYASDNDAETLLLDQMGNPIDEEEFETVARAGAAVPLQMVDFEGEELAMFGIQKVEGAVAFDQLASGELSFVFADTPVTPRDVQVVEASGGGSILSLDQQNVIAVDGLTVVVHPENALVGISVAQIRDVLAGRITNWSQLGGADAPITVYSYEPGSDANRGVQALLLTPAGINVTSTATRVATSRELTSALAVDPNGIGIVGYHGKRDMRVVPLTNECGMSIEASPFTIKTEEYPLSIRVAAYSRAGASDFARAFKDHMGGQNIDGLVSKAGYIDLSVVPQSELGAQARAATARAAQFFGDEKTASDAMIDEMQGSVRLSTTFRFAPASAVLDNRSSRDLGRMVEYLTEQNARTVYVAGFADAAGAFGANARLSEARAQAVLDQLRAADTTGALASMDLLVRGYSELSPVACNETFEGRANNRRVEIWIK